MVRTFRWDMSSLSLDVSWLRDFSRRARLASWPRFCAMADSESVSMSAWWASSSRSASSETEWFR